MTTHNIEKNMQVTHTPGGNASTQKMPGHWVLAKLGKRVLRPGGVYLTGQMLKALQIDRNDHVVEFAPGLGFTAKKTVSLNPASYTAIERDENAARMVNQAIGTENYQCRVASAEESGLDDQQSTVVYGEAMLTMQTEANKRKIIKEANRILAQGGRYGIHEIALQPDEIDADTRHAIRQDLSRVIHHGVNPLTLPEWEQLFNDEGFHMRKVETAPMALLEIKRIIQDEGFFRFLKIITRLLFNPTARARVMEMRSIFKKHSKHMQAFVMVFEKKSESFPKRNWPVR